MTRDARSGTKHPGDQPNHLASRGTIRLWVIGMLFAAIGLLPSVATPILIGDGVSLGPAGTYVAAVVFDPTTPTTLYVGTNGGGVFKSTDGGGSWQAVNTGLANLGVNALALDPTIPTTLYAGTNGGGVFKSMNGGGNWQSMNTGLTYLLVYALALDPTTPTTLYAGMYCNCPANPSYVDIFKSTVGGGSWQAMNTGMGTVDVLAFAIDPKTPTTLYAGSNHVSKGVFKSTDGGGSWQGASIGLPLFESVIALAIDPTTPTTLYAGTLNSGVFKSTDGGGNWQAVNTGFTNLSFSVYTLALNPMTPATLYAGTEGGGVFESTDGGAHWIPVAMGLTNLNVNALALDPTAPAILYAGTWGSGVFKYVEPPGKATLRSPAGGIAIAATPIYTWSAVPGATWYEIWVSDGAQSRKIDQWYTADGVGCPGGTGTCAVAPSVPLATGAATWWIQCWGPSGYGTWSAGMPFTVSLPSSMATLVSPGGAITTPTPTYTWNAVPGMTWYFLWVDDTSKGGKVQQWIEASTAGCGSGTGTCSYKPSTSLAPGTAT